MGRNKVVVAVSGGFDPVHVGHIRLFEAAKNLGDRLVVVLNNDNWLRKKKGFVFMGEKQRKEILQSIKYVDNVFITNHKPDCEDMSVREALQVLQPDIFANGGDRKMDNVPEVDLCKAMKIEMKFNVGRGGKIQSSSGLIKQIKGSQV